MAEKRIAWLDTARGIGIIAVVLGHIVTIGGPIHNLIFAFHMPLFFMLSGYVYKDRPLGALLRRSARRLLLPFAGFLLAGAAVSLAVPIMREYIGRQLARSVYTGSPDCVNNSSIWFLLSLFWVTMAYGALCKIPRRGLRACVLAACLIAGLGFGLTREKLSFLPWNRLPLTLDCSLTAMVFFALGHAARERGWMERPLPRGFRGAALFIALLAAYVLAVWRNGTMNLNSMSFGNPLLYYFCALAGSLLTIWFSRALCGVNAAPAVRALSFYGRNSLWILGTHKLLIAVYIAAAYYLAGAQLLLYRFPRRHQLVSFLLIGFVLCPGICLARERLLKKKGNK